MPKNSNDVYGAKSRSNVLLFDPEDLTIVKDPKHPLYDERIHLPVDEALVKNIMFQGILETIVFAKDGETGDIMVVDGRQRVRACKEANKRLKAQGCEPVLVPGMPRRGDAAALAGVMVSANEIRQDDTPLGRAKKMQRLLDFGKSEHDLGILFGCSKPTVKSTLALLECSAAVKTAIENGKIGITHAYQLAKMDVPKQKETLDKMLKAAEGETGRNKRGKKMREVVQTGPVMRTRAEVSAMLALKVDGVSLHPVAKATLEWVLGISDNERTFQNETSQPHVMAG